MNDMQFEKLIDERNPNKEITREIFIKGNTGNDFQFYNIDNPYDMNKVYRFYENYAKILFERFSPKNNIFNQKPNKTLDFSYNWEKKLNAGSFEWYTKDIIEINEGTIMKIYAFFYTVMAKGNILGMSKREDRVLELKQYFHNKFKNDIIVPMTYCGSIAKNNIAEYMAKFAIEFLIGHEIGHVLNGHTKLYMDIRDKLNEETNQRERKKLFLDLQTLEMDADTFGICRVLEEVVWFVNQKDKIFNYLEQEEDIFKLLCYAIHGLFYILRDEYEYDDMKDYEEQSHPPKFVREAMLYGALDEHIKYLYEKEYTKYNFDFKKSNLGEMEYSFCEAIGKKNSEYIRFVKNNVLIMEQHRKKINDNWERISHILKPEARVPIEGIDY